MDGKTETQRGLSDILIRDRTGFQRSLARGGGRGAGVGQRLGRDSFKSNMNL